MKILEEYRNYTIIDGVNTNHYYVKEFPFLTYYKGTINHDISLNELKIIIDNYILNHYVYGDYHIVWEYYGKAWDFQIYTIDKKWHSYTNSKSHLVFPDSITHDILQLFNIKVNKSNITDVNKLIYRVLDKNDVVSSYCRLDKIPTTTKALANILNDISSNTYYTDVWSEVYDIPDDILRSYRLLYIENFLSLNVDEYNIIFDIDTNILYHRKSIAMRVKNKHDDILIYFIKKYLIYLFGEVNITKYINQVLISTKPTSTFHLTNMLDMK